MEQPDTQKADASVQGNKFIVYSLPPPSPGRSVYTCTCVELSTDHSPMIDNTISSSSAEPSSSLDNQQHESPSTAGGQNTSMKPDEIIEQQAEPSAKEIDKCPWTPEVVATLLNQIRVENVREKPRQSTLQDQNVSDINIQLARETRNIVSIRKLICHASSVDSRNRENPEERSDIGGDVKERDNNDQIVGE